MDKTWYWRVLVFCQGVFHFRSEGHHFTVSWDNLFADRIVWVVRINQGNEIRCYIHPEEMRFTECLTLRFGKGDYFTDFICGIQAMTQLPAPVVPLFFRDICESRGTCGWERYT